MTVTLIDEGGGGFRVVAVELDTPKVVEQLGDVAMLLAVPLLVACQRSEIRPSRLRDTPALVSDLPEIRSAHRDLEVPVAESSQSHIQCLTKALLRGLEIPRAQLDARELDEHSCHPWMVAVVLPRAFQGPLEQRAGLTQTVHP